MVDRPSGHDVQTAVDAVAAALDAVTDGDRWDRRAGILTWSCRATLAHVVDCLSWYASLLARRSRGDVETPELDPARPVPVLVDSLRSMGALLVAVVDVAPADARAWHPYGIADRSGFAAMGCDEVLVHGADLAAGIGFPYAPPAPVIERTLRRLFPWAPVDADPWEALLWANGRAPLGDRPPEKKWKWQCAPLSDWDGEIRRF